MRALLARIAGMFGKARRDRELAEELESHLAMQMDDNLRAGMTPEEARRAALLMSGGLEQAKEACRDRRGLPSVESALRDLRHAVRMLRRSPAFTAVAVLLLALGIGANSAIFTLLDQVVLRRLPVKDPEQLVMITTTGPHFGSNQGSKASSYPMYQDFQRLAPAFSQVFCRRYTSLSATFGTETERVTGEMVSGNFFQALGVGAAVGRVFTPEEDDRTYQGHPVVVLSHQYWATRFAADPGVVGRKVLINSYPMTVVGVSAEGFPGLDPAQSPQVRVPIQMKPILTPGSDNLGNRRSQWVQVFARLKPGYTPVSAEASLQPLLSQILREELREPALRELPQDKRDRFLARKVRVAAAASGYSELRQRYSTALVVLMATVGLVLIIACFNIAGLLIARAAARQKEVAVRLALGASRGQLARQLLVESATLSGAGAVVGLLVSVALIRGLLGFLPGGGMPLTLQAWPDWRIVGFNLAIAFLTCLVFGLAPAWQTGRVDLCTALKESGASGSGSAVRLRKCLVAAQVAFSFLLLAGAGLLIRTLVNLRETNPGFRNLDNLVTFQVDPGQTGSSLAQVKAFHRRVQESVRSLPGVKAAGFAWIPVLTGRESDWEIVAEGRALRDGGERRVFVNCISPGYWRTLGLRLLEGRDFDGREEGTHFGVAVVNRALAEHLYPGRSAVGRRIGLGREPDIEIVGVVENALNEGVREGVRRQAFFPFSQAGFPYSAAFYVRTSLPSETMYAALRQAVRELNPSLPLYEMNTLQNQLDEALATERLTATLSSVFGLLATLLAAVGLYGVMVLTVSRRTREIGLRMALGAPRAGVLWMVLREALVLVGVGLAVGIPCAASLNRYLAPQLFGITPGDLPTVVLAVVSLAAVAAGAALLPARRASRIDPIRALRHE